MADEEGGNPVPSLCALRDGPKELLHTVEISHATGNVPADRQVVHEHPTILGAVVLSMDYMDLIDQEQLARIANSILWLG
jgi:hypothetical protein